MHFSSLSCEQLYQITCYMLKQNYSKGSGLIEKPYKIISSANSTKLEKQKAFDVLSKDVFHPKFLRDTDFTCHRDGRPWGQVRQDRLIDMLLFKIMQKYGLTQKLG